MGVRHFTCPSKVTESPSVMVHIRTLRRESTGDGNTEVSRNSVFVATYVVLQDEVCFLCVGESQVVCEVTCRSFDSESLGHRGSGSSSLRLGPVLETEEPRAECQDPVNPGTFDPKDGRCREGLLVLRNRVSRINRTKTGLVRERYRQRLRRPSSPPKHQSRLLERTTRKQPSPLRT